MRTHLIQLSILLVVYIALSYFSPFLIANATQSPEFFQDSNSQFILNLIVSFIFAFNPVTKKFAGNQTVEKTFFKILKKLAPRCFEWVIAKETYLSI